MLRSPLGYLAAVLLVLVGWVAATVIAAGAWDPIREANVTPVTEKKADAAGLTLAVYTDIPQPDRTINCFADGPKKDQTTPIPPAKIQVTTEVDGTEWLLVAVLAEGRDGVTVKCTPRDRRVDNASYSYAVVDGCTSRAEIAQSVAIIGLLAGIGVTAATFWTRRKMKKEGQAPA